MLKLHTYLSPRQVYRLVKRFIEFGASGLVSLQRGRPGNHRYDENMRSSMI
ncbi:TPA: helix-turn-helix domain-containing protein [Photobacterium damselae]